MNTLSSPSPAAVPHVTDAAEPRGWFATLDPARIAGRFAGLAFAFALLASLAGLALRVELLTPALDSVTPRTFGALLSLHGTLMMYFVALPLFPGVLGHAPGEYLLYELNLVDHAGNIRNLLSTDFGGTTDFGALMGNTKITLTP